MYYKLESGTPCQHLLRLSYRGLFHVAQPHHALKSVQTWKQFNRLALHFLLEYYSKLAQEVTRCSW